MYFDLGEFQFPTCIGNKWDYNSAHRDFFSYVSLGLPEEQTMGLISSSLRLTEGTAGWDLLFLFGHLLDIAWKDFTITQCCGPPLENHIPGSRLATLHEMCLQSYFSISNRNHLAGSIKLCFIFLHRSFCTFH